MKEEIFLSVIILLGNNSDYTKVAVDTSTGKLRKHQLTPNKKFLFFLLSHICSLVMQTKFS